MNSKSSLLSEMFIQMSTLFDFSSIFPPNFLQPIKVIQTSTPSQSQALNKNLKEKWKKNQISAYTYLHKPFREKATFSKGQTKNYEIQFDPIVPN